MKSRYILVLISLIIVSCSQQDPKITENELFGHLSYLASDSLKGRYPGTPEDRLSALYIAEQFKEAGLELLAERGLQAFDVITDLEKGKDNALTLDGEDLQLDEDFAPFPFTANKSAEAEVVFAGYGFEIKDEELDWNDYMNIEAEGKWVLVLRGNPELDNTASMFNAYSNERDKAMVAADKGAAGILFVAGPGFGDDALTDLDRREGKLSIPAIQITSALADKLLMESGKSLEMLEKQLNEERKPVSFSLGKSLLASAEVKPSTTTTYNVVAFLEGNDPERKKEYIVLGAHYDHLGMGGPGSSSRKQDTTGVHNGADDNASGVAALIEIAENIAAGSPANSYLFIAFGAEEMGLLGSKYYVQNPLLPLEDARVMLNLDMVGRLRDNQVQIAGVGTAEESSDLVTTLGKNFEFSISTTNEGYGASDHSSFYGKDIPVLFITTGAHTDYHTPEDDVDLVNLPGMVRVSDYVSSIAFYVDSTNTPMEFQEAGPKVQYMGRRGRRIALGIMPDFTDNDDTPGMRVDFVTEGKPAGLGGMKKGDYIMAIEGKPVNGIYDYMYRLQKLEKGQVIVVTVKRGDQNIDLLVEL